MGGEFACIEKLIRQNRTEHDQREEWSAVGMYMQLNESLRVSGTVRSAADPSYVQVAAHLALEPVLPWYCTCTYVWRGVVWLGLAWPRRCGLSVERWIKSEHSPKEPIQYSSSS